MVRYKNVMKEYGLGTNEEILTLERGEDATIRPGSTVHIAYIS
jgi:hypothetical protein